jgi:ribosomal protein S19
MEPSTPSSSTAIPRHRKASPSLARRREKGAANQEGTMNQNLAQSRRGAENPVKTLKKSLLHFFEFAGFGIKTHNP